MVRLRMPWYESYRPRPAWWYDAYIERRYRRQEPQMIRPTEQQALARARSTFTDYLTAEQKRTYRLEGYVDVVSNKGRTWRIYTHSYVKNVECIKARWWCFGMRGIKYCAHSQDTVPASLTHLTQLLTLMTDERAFRRVAHRWFP